jgi:hypothetical protein
MRIKYTLLVFFIIFQYSLAQGKTTYEEGFIVTLKNDTIYGKIADRKEGTFPKILKKIKFKTTGSMYAKKYSANQIKGYKVGKRIYESISISTENKLFEIRYKVEATSKKTFLRVVSKGKLSYYHWEHTDFEFHTIDYIPLFHVSGRNEMVRVTQGVLGLKRKNLSEYFSGCSELSKTIENKEVKTAEEIIEKFYLLCK